MTMRRKSSGLWRAVSLALAVTGGVVTGSGCGGGSKSSSPVPQPAATVPPTEPATFSVTWPSDAEAQAGPITKSAKSIRVRVTNELGGTPFGETLLVRPSGGNSETHVTLPPFAAFAGRMIATAYASEDGTGPVLASVQARLNFNRKGFGGSLVRLVLAGTVGSLSVTAPNEKLNIFPTAAAGVPTAFYATPFYATPEEVRGFYILVPPGTIHWHSETPELASVDDNGVVTGLASGIARITATLDATETNSAQTGTGTITITAPIAPAGDNVRAVALNAASLACDKTSGKLWASVPGSDSIRSIDTNTLALGTPIPLGGTPGKIAISDDGKYLYAALTNKPQVCRVNLATSTVDKKFSLGKDDQFGDRYALDIEVAPGTADIVAITRRSQSQNALASVAIYDNGVARIDTVPYQVSSLTWGTDATQLYGLGTSSLTLNGSPVLARISVSSNGAHLVQSESVSAASGLAFASGRLYTSDGAVQDAQTLESLPGFIDTSYFTFAQVSADPGCNRAFFLTVQTTGDNGRTYLLRAFDTNTRTLAGQAALLDPPGLPAFNDLALEQLGDLTRWGSKGLAFRTNRGFVFLVTNAPGL